MRTLEAPSSTNQKTTNFDYAAFCKENEMLCAYENAPQVRAAIAPAKARSPLSKIKRDRTVLRASLGASAKKQRILTAKCHHDQEKITNIMKLGVHAWLIMTDSCNAAQKARRLLQHKIGGVVYELDCHHHLRNVWIKGMELSVSSYLWVIVTNSLEKIPPEL